MSNPIFREEMKKDYTILAPLMLPIHFSLFEKILRDHGYRVEVLRGVNQNVIHEGLQNVHNDICYPALLVIGQMIDALKSGRYDVHKTALMITQTGGGCRASNYIHLLRKALVNSGFSQVPVISVNLSGLEKEGALPFTPSLLLKISFAILYGDLLLCLWNQCRPYEKHKGETKRLLDAWIYRLNQQFSGWRFLSVRKNYDAILREFAALDRTREQKIRVGIVGEIYMKYSPLGNNSLEDFLVKEGAEPVVSGLMDFILYSLNGSFVDEKLCGKKHRWDSFFSLPKRCVIGYIKKRQMQMIRAVEQQGAFRAPVAFDRLERLVEGYISRGVKMGEGWLLTAEMLELMESGVRNVVCTQPFGCLPNHIVAKGMIRKIKTQYPDANIAAIDYDPGATKINQENRLKLMLSNAQPKRGKKNHFGTLQEENFVLQ